MVDIGISQPVVLPPLPSTTLQAGQGSLAGAVNNQSIPTTSGSAIADQNSGGDQIAYDAQAVEQKRADAVKAASQQAAETFVVSDHSFTIFKDATGQYITRFTSLRDGKVTYIPEPNIFKMGNSGGSSSQPLVQIKA